MDYLAFRVSGGDFAVSLLRVQKVSILGSMTRVPGAAPAIRGVLNRHGSVIPIVDLAVRLGLPRTRISARTCVMDASALLEGTTSVVGLVVDAPKGILRLTREDVRAPPQGLFAREPDLLVGLADVDGRLVPLLDVDVLVDPSRLAMAVPAPDAASMEEPGAGSAVSARPCERAAADGAAATPVAPAPGAGLARADAGPLHPRDVSAGAAGSRPGPSAGAPGSAAFVERTPRRIRPPAPPASLRPAPASHGRTATLRPRMALQDAPAPAWPGEGRARGISPRERRGSAAWLGSAAAGAALLLLLAFSSIGGGDGEARPRGWPRGGGAAVADPPPVHRDSAGVPAAARLDAPAEPSRVEAPSPPPATSAARAVHLETARAPDPSSARGVHQVHPGDSLWALSGRYLGNPFLWPRLFEANRDRIEDPDLITPGQRLVIPRPR